MNYKVGDLLEVRIEKIVPGGFGLAFAEELTVFVALPAVGDRARVRIDLLKGKSAFAEIVEILEPSPDRRRPPCIYVGACGGCDFQQMNYDAQLLAKVEIVRDCLKRIGKIDFAPEISIFPSPNEFEYRSRAQWHVDKTNNAIGYFRRNSRDVIDIEHCPILVPELDTSLAELRNNFPWAKMRNEKAHIDSAVGDVRDVSVFSPGIFDDASEIFLTANDEKYFFSAQTFFQGNRSLIPQLVETALSGAKGNLALDLYCGVGLFTLPLARKFSKVIAVEDNKLAMSFTKKNAEEAKLDDIQFESESVRRFLRDFNVRAMPPANAGGSDSLVDFILLDPPRSGMEKETLQNIIELRAPRISYVSCEPAGMARDLRKFLDAGYAIQSIIALDLFPQTHHIETITILESSKSGITYN